MSKTTDRTLGDLLDLVDVLDRAHAAAQAVGYGPVACKLAEVLDFARDAAGELYEKRFPSGEYPEAVLVHRGRAYFPDYSYPGSRVRSLPFVHADEVPIDEAEAGR